MTKKSLRCALAALVLLLLLSLLLFARSEKKTTAAFDPQFVNLSLVFLPGEI